MNLRGYISLMLFINMDGKAVPSDEKDMNHSRSPGNFSDQFWTSRGIVRKFNPPSAQISL